MRRLPIGGGSSTGNCCYFNYTLISPEVEENSVVSHSSSLGSWAELANIAGERSCLHFTESLLDSLSVMKRKTVKAFSSGGGDGDGPSHAQVGPGLQLSPPGWHGAPPQQLFPPPGLKVHRPRGFPEWLPFSVCGGSLPWISYNRS